MIFGGVFRLAGHAREIEFDPEMVEISLNDVPVLKKDYTIVLDEPAAHQALARDFVVVHIDLDRGRESARFWTCDLTKEYVHINASYRS